MYVYADTAMTNALRAVREAFAKTHPEIRIEFSFVDAANMPSRLDSSLSANLVLSANALVFEQLAKQNRIETAPRVVTRNPLVVFIARTNPAGIERIEDLTRGDLAFAIANEKTPLGQATRTLVENMRHDLTFGPEFSQVVLDHVSAESDDANSIFESVLLNHADVGIVYASDANLRLERITLLDLPKGLDVTTAYSAAILKSTHASTQAQLFFDFVTSPPAQAIFAEYGFQTNP